MLLSIAASLRVMPAALGSWALVTFAVGLMLDLLGGPSVTSWMVAIMSVPNIAGVLAIQRVSR